jgi:hypothetical protein
MRHTAAFGLILTSLIGVAFFVIDARATAPRPPSPETVLATSTRSATADFSAPAPTLPARTVHTAAVASAREVQTEAVPVAATTTTVPASAAAQAVAHLTVAASTTRSFELPIEGGTSLADAMTALAKHSDFSFRSHESSGMGMFIDSIEGLSNADGYYWILWINGAKAGVGASSLVLHPGDEVGWRYEKGY